MKEVIIYFFDGQNKNVINSKNFPIPDRVERAIINGFFEGMSDGQQPAIIGRVIPGQEYEIDWSVVALISGNNNIQSYRYFLIETKEGMQTLVKFLQSHYEMWGVYPNEDALIDIFEEQYISYLDENHSSQSHQILSSNTDNFSPIVSKSNLSLKETFEQATQLTNGSPLAFAHNVSDLLKPRSFHLIQPNGIRESGIIKRRINRENKAINPDSIRYDEVRIKLAIAHLINFNNLSLVSLNIFLKEINESNIPKNYWHKIFDDLGASLGINKTLYPPLMVKLLSLRCFPIPETTQDFLLWLQASESQEVWQTYKDFRDNIANYFDSLSNKSEGFKEIYVTIKPDELISQAYEIYLDGQLVLKKEKEIFEVRPTKEQLNLIQLAIEEPHKVLNQVQIKHQQQILYWVENGQVLKNSLIEQDLKT